MIAYKKNQDRTHFVEVSIEADYVYERTGDFRYEKTLKKLVEDNEQVISAFILDTDFNYIESTFREESIGVSEETIKIYRKVFAGETHVREKYSRTNNKKVLEILSPIEIDGEIKELISIYYTIDFYNIINTRTIIVMLSLSIIIILTFTSFIIIFLVRPLTYLENSVLSFNADFGTYKRPVMNYYVFKDAYKALDNLSMHIQNSNLEKTELNNSIYELALTDYLTKLPNRLGLVQTINKYIVDDVKFALIFIDLDNFKTFNDTKGHAYGDRILVKVSTILKKYTHERLYTGRYGGDEFIILFKYEKRKHIEQMLKHLYDKFKTPIILDHERNYVDLSGGVSLFPEHGNDAVELIRKADLAMYDSKLKGKNTYMYYNKNMDIYLEQEIKIKHEIEKSLSNDGIKIVLQPQVDVETNEIIYYEALARLTSNKYGPGEFIQVAEKHNLIDELGIIVIDSVIKVLTSFKDHNLKLKTIYVNFSINQVKNEELINYILTELKKYDLHPKYFGIEITENILILDEEFSEAYFKELISQGFKIAIDDFGSGNASINYLVKYPLGLVKLDRSFVNKYLNQDSVVVFDTFVKLAEELNYQVLAEGVETIEQVELLKKSKCKYAQGYYFYKPLEVSEIIKLANNTLNK